METKKPVDDLNIQLLQEDFIKHYPTLLMPTKQVLIGLMKLIDFYNQYMFADYKSINSNKEPERHSYSVETLNHIVKLYISEDNSMGHWPEGSVDQEYWLRAYMGIYIDAAGLRYEVTRAIEILEKVTKNYQAFDTAVSDKINEAVVLLDEALALASK
jgi:hypothetical protein